ncbi:S-layer homology domain-containing protein [Paenibacillus sp. PR3]|uniref:S-layer homology domain-containing protein n=1 Tax=Paenibacillus terricola TaxID=2763503 RepID=A0ABR8N0R2_9BACL|nr:S-layer homology domain-containing protein [Paenibacillus terricola]MBD3921785.1 S-layer homology domain-containing protein [Paenibacillus terricola]
MLKRRLIMLLSIFILVMGVPVGTVMAQDTNATFELKLKFTDKDVKLSIIGHGLMDMYAYDLELSYDENILAFSKAETSIAGFSVQPILSANTIRIAHTKIGETSGEKGNVELSAITFKRIGAGATAIKLSNIKLVDSKLDMVTLEPKVTAAVKDDPNVLIFSDIKGHWAKEAIERAAALGITSGYPDGTFRPGNKVTRAEFTTMITHAFTLQSATGITPEFADAAMLPQWAKTSIAEAAGAGIVTGYADGTFRPNQLITRTEMTAILVRVLDLQMNAQGKPTFADTDQIPAWAQPSIVAAVNAGIIKGTGGNNFSPKSNASRAESVTIIMAALDYQAGQKG